jgi:hypothetical protein
MRKWSELDNVQLWRSGQHEVRAGCAQETMMWGW